MYRKISAILVPTIIAIGIMAYILYSVWDRLILAVRNMIPEYLLFAILICLAAWWLRGWRYRTILLSLSYNVGVLVSTACIFISQTANLIVPARLGDLVRALILKHEYNASYSEGVSSFVVERVFDIVTVALLGVITLLLIFGTIPEKYGFIVIILLAGGIFFVFLLFMRKSSAKNRYIGIILTMIHEIRKASLSIRSIIVLIISSLVIWMLDVFVCVAVIMMFHEQISLAVVVLAIVVGNLLKAIPITPGGIVAYELSVAAILHEFGSVSSETAFIVAVTDHLIKNLVTLGGGIVSIYLFGDWVIPSIKQALNTKLGGE